MWAANGLAKKIGIASTKGRFGLQGGFRSELSKWACLYFAIRYPDMGNTEPTVVVDSGRIGWCLYFPTRWRLEATRACRQ